MRLRNIDVLKSICSFLVVCIHIPFPGQIGEYFTALCRVAVPIFFMITGYFYTNCSKEDKKFRQIKKILLLVIEANFIYFLFCLFLSIRSHSWISLIQNSFSLKSLVTFSVFNESPFGSHLWYLGAILYVLVIILIVDKLHCRKFLYYLSPELLVMDLLFGKYALAIWGREFPVILVRNFLFVGIPYFCIGLMIKEGLGRNLHKKVLQFMVVLFSITSLLERYILIGLNVNATRDHYISTTFLSISIFLLAIKSENLFCKKSEKGLKYPMRKTQQIFSVLETIGHKYSTWIYILHPLFITCIGAVVNRLGLYSKYKLIAPMIVYMATVIFIWLLTYLKELVKKSNNDTAVS